MARTLNAAVYTIRREAFIDVAQRLITQKGYEQMSIQDLLDELEASRGAFYHYFDSKQELLEAVIERMVDAGLAAVAPIVEDPQLTALEKLMGVFGGIGRWKTDRKAFVLSLLEVWISDENAIVREKFRRGLAGHLLPLLSTIVKQGMVEEVFNVSSPVATAQVMLMLLLGLQEVATDLYIAHVANTVTYEEVVGIFASYADAFERVLGAPTGTVDIVDDTVMREWFG
jgi:AcrR family transcriptional regulator